MKVKDSNYADYQTARQWALRGYLPVDGAAGVELWANAYCRDSYTYYSPEHVNTNLARKICVSSMT